MWGRRAIQVVVACTLFVCLAIAAQQKQTTLNNDAVVSMIKGGMPDSMVVSVIQSSETQFDVSAGALAELKKAGVSQKVIDAMVAAEARKHSAAPPSKASGVATRAAAPPAQQPPYAVLVQGATRQDLAAETTQIAPVNTKSQDLNALALDATVMQALQGVAAGLAEQAGSKLSTTAGSSLGGAASDIVGGLFKKRKPTVLFLWAVAGRAASSTIPTNTPTFEVFYSGIPGVNSNEYTPVLVKLVSTQNDWRLVGAAKGQTDALQSTTSDWETYSSFIEEKVPTRMAQSAPGQVQIVPGNPLEPGEYGLVLRPVSKNKKFSGANVANHQGEALVFGLVWAFSVGQAASAQ